MWDMNQPQDVIALMRDGEMTDEQIIEVCEAVIKELRIINSIEKKEL